MIVVINGVGANTNSICFAIERLSLPYELSSDPTIIQKASHVILPGVGSAKQGMRRLMDLNLVDVIKNLQVPVLGICLGMQLLFSHSEEGDLDLLNSIPGKIKRFPSNNNLVVPHMGWNQIEIKDKNNVLLSGIEDKSHLYFVHSYFIPVSEFTVATCDYGEKFSSIIHYKNFYGMQFHPERSGVVGEALLKNFFTRIEL